MRNYIYKGISGERESIMKKQRKMLCVFMTVIIILSNVTMAMAATGVVKNGRIVIKDGGTQLYGGTWVCQIDDGREPLLDACCCDPLAGSNPDNGVSVSMTGYSSSSIEARMAYICYKNWETASDNRKYSLSRACGIATGSINYGGYGYQNRAEVESLYNQAKNLSSAPAGFEAYLCVPSNGTQNQLAWRYNPKGSLNLKKTADDPEGITVDFPSAYTLKGAEYGVYRNSDCTGRAGTLVTDISGNTDSLELDEGTYYVKEIKAPRGYALDNNIYTVYVPGGELKTLHVTEKPEYGSAKIKKAVKSNIHLTELCKDYYSLEGAEYRIYNADTGNIAGTLVTDKNGDTGTVNLPAGKYYAEEIKAPAGFILNAERTETLTVTAGNTVTFTHKDMPAFDTLEFQLEKRSEEGTDKRFSPEGAEYKVRYYKDMITENQADSTKPFRTWVIKTKKHSDGRYIAMLNDSYIVKEKSDELFKTDSGKAAGLPGTYVITEEKAPLGYARTEGIISCQQSSYDHILQKESFLKDVVTLEKPQTVSIILEKTDAETGKSEAQGHGSLKGAVFEVFHYDELKGKNISDGHITTDNEGRGMITLLKPGIYKVREIKAPDGYVKSNEIKTVEAGINEHNKAVLEYLCKWEEDVTRTEVFKCDDRGKSVEGAVLQVTHEDGTLIEEFTTGKEPFVIKGLNTGSYVLKEKEVPEGYVKSEDVIFEIKEGVEKTEVKMTDLKAGVEKVHGDNDYVEGAELAVYDEEGNETDSWISGKEKHYVNNLEYGKTYTLKEINTPEGYVTASPVSFTVEGEKNIDIIMKDIKAVAEKKDMEGNSVKGAELAVYDKEGKEKDRWITDGKGHEISGLKENETYTIKETGVPYGYVKAMDMEFSTFVDKEKQDISIIMEDMRVSVNKVDEKNEPLKGAELSVTDSNGKEIERWVSDGTLHYISGLNMNTEYILKEIKAPDGYATCEEVKFSTNGKNDINISLVNEDIKVEITKVKGDSNNPLAGAVLQIVDKNGKVTEEWVSSDRPHRINNIPAGEYILREVSAPEGYTKAGDQKLIVKDTSSLQSFTLNNVLAPVTGDDSMLFLYLMIMISASGAVAAMRNTEKKREHNKEV